MAASNSKSVLDTVIDQTVKEVTFIPFGSSKSLTLTMEEARHIVANPTKSGKLPSDRDVSLFLKLCEFRGLNPYVGDAYLVGYDGKDGPSFSSVVTHSAMLKRADANADYAGKESGVIIWDKDTRTKQYIIGDVCPATEVVVGGWCRVFRKDRKDERAETLMKSYNKGFGHWSIDPNWMITKCAEAKAMRAAFPNDLGGLEIQEEVAARQDAEQRAMDGTMPIMTSTDNSDLLSQATDVASEPTEEEKAEILAAETSDLFEKGSAEYE